MLKLEPRLRRDFQRKRVGVAAQCLQMGQRLLQDIRLALIGQTHDGKAARVLSNT